MRDVYAVVQNLGGDTVERLPYEIEVDGGSQAPIVGNFHGKCSTPYRRLVASIDGRPRVRVVEGDPRVSVEVIDSD